jgi:hypothetical protein
MFMKEDTPKNIPPWVQHFLVHVVKRCAMVLVRWIESVQEESKRGESQKET